MKFNNRSKKLKENLENTLGERDPLRVWRSWGEGESNPLETEGIRWRRSQITLGEPWPLQEREERGFARLGFEGVLSPLIYIGWNLRPRHVQARSRTCPASRICPGHRLDMSSENYLDSSENIRNFPKNWYSMDFGVGPIEYIYPWHMDKFWKNKTYIYIHIYGLKPLES
jgi:hypothetical protein